MQYYIYLFLLLPKTITVQSLLSRNGAKSSDGSGGDLCSVRSGLSQLINSQHSTALDHGKASIFGLATGNSINTSSGCISGG